MAGYARTGTHEQTLIGSVRRALRMIEMVAESPRPLPVKVLANRLGLSLGTTYNLARTLVHDGYLVTEPEGLVLGTAMPGLRPTAAEPGVTAALIRSTLNSLTRALNASTYFSRYIDGEIQVVDVVDVLSGPRLELWVGVEASAHASALGKQILAELPEPERAEYLAQHPLTDLTPNTIRDKRALLQVLAQHPDITVDREEYALGHMCFAVPVRAPGVIGSLAISRPIERVDRNPAATVASLRDAARTISLRLGADAFDDFSI